MLSNMSKKSKIVLFSLILFPIVLILFLLILRGCTSSNSYPKYEFSFLNYFFLP